MNENELRPYLEELIGLDDEWNISEWMEEFPVDRRVMENILFAVREYLKTNISPEQHRKAVIDYLTWKGME